MKSYFTIRNTTDAHKKYRLQVMCTGSGNMKSVFLLRVLRATRRARLSMRQRSGGGECSGSCLLHPGERTSHTLMLTLRREPVVRRFVVTSSLAFSVSFPDPSISEGHQCGCSFFLHRCRDIVCLTLNKRMSSFGEMFRTVACRSSKGRLIEQK